VSGLRKCAECDRLFRIENDGPEPMRVDGTFPRHECSRCHHLKVLKVGLAEIKGSKTEIVKTGTGPEVHVIVPYKDAEAHVLSIRFRNDKLVADVAEEESGKILHDEITFEIGHEEALEPLLAVL
jgi:hypothetical protein